MRICWSDTETYSEVPIANGTHAYAEKAEVMLWAFAIDDGPVEVWDLTAGAPMPDALAAALADPDFVFTFHNSHFDRTVLRHCGFEIPVSRVHDTMVKSLAHSLPGGLGKLCEIFDLPVDKAKDKDGRRLVPLFCKPHPEKKGYYLRRATRETHPAEWAKFVEYARLDVEAMRAVDAKLPTWNCSSSERALWELDQAVNDRGFAVDVDMARAAIASVQVEQARLADRTQALTDGDVQAATQRDEMLRHITRAYGVMLPDMQQSTLERRINDPDLPAALRELLAIRLQASTTSTAKYQTLLRAVSKDGRRRGTLQFCGAARTGRWAGRLFQAQNLARPTMPSADIACGIDAVKAGCADLLFDRPLELLSNCLRGVIVAPPGRKLACAALANIEGRVLAWLAGEQWKLQAFRDYDAGEGPDLYKMAYAKSFGVSPDDVTKDQRQIGKVQELALGYEGGVGAFVTFAAAYGIDLEAMAEQAFSAIPGDVLDEARSALEWTKREGRPTFGLSDRAWMVCDSFKRAWRYGHHATASFWRDLQDAARLAVQNPGRVFDCRRVSLRRDGAWLRIRLPSGRFLCYPGIRLGEGNKLSYMGVNQYTRQWARLETYGGKLAENITQAVARDVLADSMPRIEAAGYRTVLSVHDEPVTETPDTPEFNATHLSALMVVAPAWAEDLPLAAEGFEAARYRK